MPTARAVTAITRLRALATRLRALASRPVTTSLISRTEQFVNRQKAMQFIMEKRFQRQSTRSVGGRHWRALKASTIRQRRRMGYGAGPILQRTVALKESAKAAVANTYRVDHSLIRWAIGRVRVKHGRYHQLGGGSLPARPFINMPDGSELAEADRMAARELRRLVRVRLRTRI
jgi:hypothetical protein